MGFLDHTTNNIVIDAVLTERGRELLSQNNGNFTISSFSFGDDEVDYTNILKYGLQMGKEKIEKNTPIFEAQTNENLALKYNNITLNNNNLRILYIPLLKLINSTSIVIDTIATNSQTYQLIEVLSTLNSTSGQTTIDNNLADRDFELKMNNLILKKYESGVERSSAYIDLDENNVATYLISGTPATTGYEGTTLSGRYLFSCQVGLSLTSPQISLNTYQKFGIINNNRYEINTQIEVLGRSSGSRVIIPIKILGPSI